MVKFTKQFEAMLVPEWKGAYLDYRSLKEELKRIPSCSLAHSQGLDNFPSSNHSLSPTVLSAVSSLIAPQRSDGQVRVKQPLQVQEKIFSSLSHEEICGTELRNQLADSEAAREFFARLDLQLNKVNQFYFSKEHEFIERGESLKLQLGILLELKGTLTQRQPPDWLKHSDDDDPSLSGSRIYGDEAFMRTVAQHEDFRIGKGDKEAQMPPSSRKQGLRGVMVKGAQFLPVTSSHERHVKINIPVATASQALSSIISLVWKDLVSVSNKYDISRGNLHANKARLHGAEKMIRIAFLELYKGLEFLTSFRSLNLSAFERIVKKFDKVTAGQALPVYLCVVESTYLNSSNRCVILMDEIDELFKNHFADGDRVATKYQQPIQCEQSPAFTFVIGLFTGCILALFTGYCIMAHVTGVYVHHQHTVYMETIYPVLSALNLLFLHLFLYGCNIIMWRKARINYSFIFESTTVNSLQCKDIFLICTLAMTLVMGIILVDTIVTKKGNYFSSHHAIPGLLLMILLGLLVCPFNLLYRSCRLSFLRVMRNIMLAPLYKVFMMDFFMADQLCSQVAMIRSLEFVACYYITRSYKTQDYGVCTRNKYNKDLSYAISFLPYYWRAMQCGRRWFDEGLTIHLLNLGKYVSAMLAAGAKVAFEKKKNVEYLSLLVILSSASTVYQLYWDFVHDWGLLQFSSRNPLLRDELMIQPKIIYFFSMALNFMLRVVWVQTVTHCNYNNIDYQLTSFILSLLEVVRRGQWNFYRLENEHLNNAGKFRAVKTMPLPFLEVVEDEPPTVDN